MFDFVDPNKTPDAAEKSGAEMSLTHQLAHLGRSVAGMTLRGVAYGAAVGVGVTVLAPAIAGMVGGGAAAAQPTSALSGFI